LCFSIGCGLPADIRDDMTNPLDRSTTTLIANILRHKIVSQSPQTQLPTGGNISAGVAAAAGSAGRTATGDVKHSPSFEGAMLFLSRLLRPLWFTPLVAMSMFNSTSSYEEVGSSSSSRGAAEGGSADGRSGDYDNVKRTKMDPSSAAFYQSLQASSSRGALPLVVSPAELDGLRRSLERFSELVEEVYRDGKKQKHGTKAFSCSLFLK
jgi:hypothetical protein